MRWPLSGSLRAMTASNVSQPELVDVASATTAVIGGIVDIAELAGFFDQSFPELATALADQQVEVVGPAFALYHGPPSTSADLEVGFPTDRPAKSDGPVRPSELPGSRVARVVHQGGYDGLATAWERLQSWISERGLTAGPVLWEVYVTEPSPDMDPADLRTELNWSLA